MCAHYRAWPESRDGMGLSGYLLSRLNKAVQLCDREIYCKEMVTIMFYDNIHEKSHFSRADIDTFVETYVGQPRGVLRSHAPHMRFLTL